MTTILKRLLVGLVLVLGLASVGQAQTQTACFTTLNGSIKAGDTTLVLTSTSTSTGCSFGSAAVGQAVFMDGELMNIMGVSSMTITVQRAVSGRAPHYTGAIIFRATPGYFSRVDPPISGNYLTGGNVICTNYPAPWINVVTGNIWWCNTKNNNWSGTNFRSFAFNSVPTAQ